MIHNPKWKWMSGAGAAFLGVTLVGCGGQNGAADNTLATTTDTSTSTKNPAPAPMDDTKASDAGYTDAATTWGQIEMAKGELDQVVMDKKLSQVHEGTFKIRELVKTLPTQSLALSDDKQKTLGAHVTEVTQLAGMLDEAGDAKNEKSTHEHHAALNEALMMIQGLYPAGALGSNMHMPGMKKSGGAMPGGMADDKMGGGAMSGNKPAMPSGGGMAAKKPMPARGMGDDPPMAPAPDGGGMGHM